MRIRFINGRVVTPAATLDGAVMHVDGAVLRDVAPVASGGAGSVIDLDGGWLLPGFVDTQVNGGGGVLFNDDPSVAGVRAIAAAHARFGTTALLPTLISDTPDVIAAALDAVDGAIDADVPGIVGVHIEGPVIDADKRGIHDPRRIRPLDAALLDQLCAPRRGRVMLTIAPERCTLDELRRLAAAGVILSAGHTNGSYEALTAAIDAGVTGFTHLFNAMSPLAHRAPGAVGAALDSDRVWCGLIVDDIHLHPAAVRIAVAAKGPDRIMLVTDAMPNVGTDVDSFMLHGRRIDVRDGLCSYADGTLAGAALDMAGALRNTIRTTGLPVQTVARMASTSSARFLGLADRHGAIVPGLRADFAWLDADLRPRGCWIGGRQQGVSDIAAARLA